MQALRNITAVFCAACICAEAVTQLVGEGWPRRCIKAAAGLYILVVLTRALPQLKAEGLAFEAPELEAVSFVTAQQSIVSAAEEQLEQTVAAQCLDETGVEVSLNITLAQNGTEVIVSEVRASLPEQCSERQEKLVAEFLRSTLGSEPLLVAKEAAM